MQALFEGLIPQIPYVVLVLLRVSIVFAALPAPLGSGSPPQVRVGLAIFLTLALVSPRFGSLPEIPIEAVPIGKAALGETLVGAVIGLTVRVTLAAAEVAGNLAGVTIGQGFAATVDPTFGEQMLPTGRLFSALAVLFFFAMNGHHVVIHALGWSLTHAPVGDALGRAVHAGTVEIGAGLMAQGLRIASPMVGAMFIVQLGMGLVARSAQRVQVFALSFAIMSAVGGIVLFASLPSVSAAIGDVLSDLPAEIHRSLGG